MTPTERAGLAVWLLLQQPMTPRSLAERLEITPHGARAMLRRLSLSLPLVDDDGQWRICGSDGTFGEVAANGAVEA